MNVDTATIESSAEMTIRPKQIHVNKNDLKEWNPAPVNPVYGGNNNGD